MKKGKLLILLAAFMSLALVFAGCNEPQEAENDTAVNENAKPGELTIGNAAEQDTAKHEIYNWFDLVADKAKPVLSEVSRLEGELMSHDIEHNLAVVREKDLDNQNYVIERWYVYDLTTGEHIFSQSVSYPYMAEKIEKTELQVSVDYPIIKEIRKGYTGGEDEYGNDDYYYDAYYYLIGENYAEQLYTTNKEEYNRYNYDNGLVCIELGDKMFWIDKNREVIRSVESIFANGYDVEGFDSEYQGYLYSYTDDELLIFDREGIVSATYLAAKDSFIEVFVLENGNALVQEFTPVTIYDSYDFVLNGTRYVVKSSIVNFVTGATEEIDIDFVVAELTSSYYQSRNEVDELVLKKAGNYGYVYNFANGYIAKGASLCVLDNSLAKLFTLENDTYGVDFSRGVYAVRDDRYIAYVNTDAGKWAIFNLKGELISYINVIENVMFTDKYIVTDTTIYDYNMTPVFDMAGSGMSYLAVLDDAIYLSYNNFKTGGVEIYVIRSDSKTPELYVDGVNQTVTEYVGDGYYVIYDVEREVYVAYNLKGEAIITSHEPFTSVKTLDNSRLFATTFNGESVVYIVK